MRGLPEHVFPFSVVFCLLTTGFKHYDGGSRPFAGHEVFMVFEETEQLPTEDCVERLPGADGSLLASTLQFMLAVQHALHLHRGQLVHLLQLLKLPEALCSPTCCEAGRSFRLLGLHLHALCSLDVASHVVAKQLGYAARLLEGPGAAGSLWHFQCVQSTANSFQVSKASYK